MENRSLYHPKISKPAFVGFMWTGVALSTCLVTFRIAVRARTFKRLYWDDVLVIFALVLFISSSISWQTQVDGTYLIYELKRGTVLPTPEVLKAIVHSLHGQLAEILCFQTILWSIKFSFMIFFRRLFDRVQRVKIWWWVVFGFVAASYITVLGNLSYKCLGGDFMYIATHCQAGAKVQNQVIITRYMAAIDVVTDCAIMSIPVLVLYDVTIPIRQKLALIATFCVTVLVMLAAIIRVAVSPSDSTWDITWLYFLIHLEITTAIAVACLASFRQLFIKASKDRIDIGRANIFSTIGKRLLSLTRLSKSQSQSQGSSKNAHSQNSFNFSFWNRSRKDHSQLYNNKTELSDYHRHESDISTDKIVVTHEVEVRQSEERNPHTDTNTNTTTCQNTSTNADRGMYTGANTITRKPAGNGGTGGSEPGLTMPEASHSRQSFMYFDHQYHYHQGGMWDAHGATSGGSSRV